MSSKLNDKVDNQIFIFSDTNTNNFLIEKIKEGKTNTNIFNASAENEPTLGKFCFLDAISENKFNLLADFKLKKLFLVTKINHFGSAFYGNSSISSPNSVFMSPIDPLMILINILFYTTCQNKIDHYRNKDFSEDNLKNFSITDFTSVSIGDLFSNYYSKLENNSRFKKDDDQINQNKLFIENFLKTYFKENEQRVELIADRSYKLLEVLFFNLKTSPIEKPAMKTEKNFFTKNFQKEVTLKSDNNIDLTQEREMKQPIQNSLMVTEKRKSEAVIEDLIVKSVKAAPKPKPKETPEVPKSQNLISKFLKKNK